MTERYRKKGDISPSSSFINACVSPLYTSAATFNMRSSLPLFAALLTAVVAFPASKAVIKSKNFKLYVTNNADIGGWAVVNSKLEDGTGLLLLQRPSVYTSINSYLLGSQQQINNGRAQLRFPINGRSYGSRLHILPSRLYLRADTSAGIVAPELFPGEVSQVAILEDHGSQRFSLGSEGKLRVDEDNTADVFYACPQNVPGAVGNPNYVLYYAPGGKATEGNLPSSKCEHIGLMAR